MNVEYQSGELLFEWDSEKAALNWQKHTVDFEEAAKVFDDEHSDDEDRWKVLGKVDDILLVIYTDREDRTRIISARRADKDERRIYYGNGDLYFA